MVWTLFERGLDKDGVMRKIRANEALGEPIRRAALEIAQGWRLGARDPGGKADVRQPNGSTRPGESR
jgi:hypothetical protein